MSTVTRARAAGRRLVAMALYLVAASLVVPSTADAQFLKKLKEAATDAAEDEAVNQVDRMVRSGVACVFNDIECIQKALDSGEDVYLTDADGEPVVDEEGHTVADPQEAAELLGEPPPPGPGASRPGAGAGPGAVGGPRPGEGAWANYDFVPGERILVMADYADDNVGDFPRRFDLIEGSFDVIEWQGNRYVRALSGGIFAIPLPETLPEKFTIETSVSLQHGNAYLRMMPGRAFQGRSRKYVGSAISAEYGEVGVLAVETGPEAMAGIDAALVRDGVVPLRIMADGEHMKVFLGERRVANVPNAVFPRSDTLFVAVGSAHAEMPILFGPLRIAGGGADLYDQLARDGRVTTQGILFDVNSDVIRPESTPTLVEIGEMLGAHPELRISIEGHTDSDGDDAFNQQLSERRAASVKAYLAEKFAIDAGRLESAGFGESKPAVPNETPEGKQQNRRVELVKLGG